MKSRAARLLEKISSKEKTIYDVNGAQEVKETEQKKMEKPCCCKNEALSVSSSENIEKLVYQCKSDLDAISAAIRDDFTVNDPLSANIIRNAAIQLKRKAEEIVAVAGKHAYSDEQIKRARASL